MSSTFSKKDSVSKKIRWSVLKEESALTSGLHGSYMVPHTAPLKCTHTNKVHTRYKEKKRIVINFTTPKV